MKLTAKQVECLRTLAKRPPMYEGWFASTTISRLRNGGLIEGVSSYSITDAGRAALAAYEKEVSK